MQELQETRVQSLGRKDPLEEAKASHSTILVWRIPWTEEPGRVHGVYRELDTTEKLTLSLPLNLVCPSVIFLASLSLTFLTHKEACLAGWLAHSK